MRKAIGVAVTTDARCVDVRRNGVEPVSNRDPACWRPADGQSGEERNER
jgi:hypothetical protein